MHIIGIIPARGGSVGIKDKNIFPLCGTPLIEYTTRAAMNSELDDWFVFTDKYRYYNTLAIPSPKKYFTGEPNIAVKYCKYCIEEYEKRYEKVDAFMLLQPTSPLRNYKDINRALELFKKSNRSSLYSGYNMRIKHSMILDNKENDVYFQRNGAIFITTRDVLFRLNVLWDDVVLFEMPKSRSIDIDNMDDMFICESLIKNGGLEHEFNNSK